MGWDIVSNNPRAGIWVASQIDGACYVPGTVSLGLLHNNKFVAGVNYEQFNGRSIVALIAVKGRMTPAFLAAIFDYPFCVCGVHKIICTIDSNNARSIRLCRKMGFSQEGNIKAAATSGGDLLIYTLEKSNCRFLKERYGKKSTRAPAYT